MNVTSLLELESLINFAMLVENNDGSNATTGSGPKQNMKIDFIYTLKTYRTENIGMDRHVAVSTIYIVFLYFYANCAIFQEKLQIY